MSGYNPDAIDERLFDLSGGTNLEAGFLVGGLLGEETSGEGLLHVGRDENAAETVFGFGATMDTNAAASRNLTEDGQEPLELWGLRDGEFVHQGGHHIGGVLEGIADVVAALNKEAGALVNVVGSPV